MRLLLTSNGLANEAIVDHFKTMLDGPFGTQNLAFVPTAANPEVDDKSWLIDDMYRFKEQKFKRIDIVDIAVLDVDETKRRLSSADVVVLGGGHTYYLRTCIDELKLEPFLKELFETRVYVGISAGSIITAPTLAVDGSSELFGAFGDGCDPHVPGLGYVDFYFRPHLNSPAFPTSSVEAVSNAAKSVTQPLFAVDDHSALGIVDGVVTQVGTGEVLRFNL